MKKIPAFLLSLVIALSLVACNSKTTDINCPNCGEPISSSASFCSSCGAKLNALEPGTEDQGKPEDSTPSTTESAPETNATSSTQPPHSHSYGEATCTSPAKCSCGATNGSALGHSWNNATCTSAKTCSRCGSTNGSALGHSYSSGKCSRCGASDPNYVAHSHAYGEATCTSPAKCSCGATNGSALGHSWNNATCTSAKTCSRCGSTNGSALGHSYSSGKCSRCGASDPNYVKPVTLYEDSSVKISFKRAEKYKYSDDRAELYFYVENKTSKTLLIQADAVSLNGYSFCNLTMSDNVTAYSIGTVNLSVEDFDFDLVNINSIYSIGGQFRIIDDATWKSYNAIFTNVKLDGTGTATRPTNFNKTNLLYSDSTCAIYYKSISKYPYSNDRAEMYFFVENKTSKTLLMQADAILINGYGFANLTMSDPVLANSVGIINLSIEDFEFSLVNINSITKLGGQLRVIDDATWKSYNAIFTNKAIH